MVHLIDKDALVTELKKRIRNYWSDSENTMGIYPYALEEVIKIIDTLEVKNVDTWHLQEKEDIYDAVKDWGLYTFACIMKDGTTQKFIGSMDEDCEGHINVHIYGVNDDYDNVDDIVKWIEF